MFFDYINNRYIGDRSKRNILIDEHTYTIGETFKLFFFKNSYGNTNIANDNISENK